MAMFTLGIDGLSFICLISVEGPGTKSGDSDYEIDLAEINFNEKHIHVRKNFRESFEFNDYMLGERLVFYVTFRCIHENTISIGPRQANLVLIAYANSEGSGEPAHPRSLARRACASVQSRQNLRCSLIQAVSQEEPSDRKSDPWPL